MVRSLSLGSPRIAIGLTVNALAALAAGSIATCLAARPAWARAQRWPIGAVPGRLAPRMAPD